MSIHLLPAAGRTEAGAGAPRRVRVAAPARPPAFVGTTEQLIAQGQAAEREGRRAHARARYEAALYRLRDPADAPQAATLMRWVARTHVDDGAWDAAEDAALGALEVSRGVGDAAGVAHATNLLGNVCRERGDLAAAEAHYRRAVALAEEAGARAVVAMAQQNIGILLNIRGELRPALKHYRASLAIHRALGQDAYAAHVLNNLGMLCTDLRRWRAAGSSYAQAAAICSALGDAATGARVESNRAELWIARGRWEEAARACEAARELAGSVGDTAALGEALKHMGVVAREQGRLNDADRHLRAAGRLATERGDLLLGAETERELAALQWVRHDHPATLRHLNRAHQLFWRLQARRDMADVARRLSSLETMFLNIVTLWGQSIESADRYTQGHCERVAGYACALAEAVGVDAGTLFWLRLGALLHDVGKIVVPPA
ncbi:MAG TPA: tetratricopeptide repeat protein, partial [Longimicrobiaceae bacterium]